MKLKNILQILACTLCLQFMLISCKKDDPQPPVNERTLFIYMPWATNLLPYFRVNIEDLKEGIISHGLKNQWVIVFLATSANEANMFEISLSNGTCTEKKLKDYTNPATTTSNGIATIIRDMQSFAPATEQYSMVIGSHGMGWIPVNSTRNVRKQLKHHYDFTDGPLTRYFGGGDASCQTDITTLADAIKATGTKFEYIMFDDCYMGNIEVAYDLKDVTNYLIASTCEIMAYGMPYQIIGPHMLGAPNYQGICDGFYQFYSTYSTPCGTLGITKCSEVEKMASIMKEINATCTFDTSLRGSIQDLDGYSPTIFFDFGHYVSKLCTDETLLARFNTQLAVTVPYSTHTGSYYSSVSKERKTIKYFSGLTISDPTINTQFVSGLTSTNWWKATH